MTGPHAMSRLRHEALLYSSDDEFMSFLTPFVAAAAEAGQPAMAVVTAQHHDAVQDAVRHLPGVVVKVADSNAKAATQLRNDLEISSGHVSRGATEVRVIGEIPHSGNGAYWEEWVRYEAAVNIALSQLPVWTVCAYDQRDTPERVVTDVARTHPWISTGTRHHRRSDRYDDPVAVASSVPPASPDPVERGPAHLLVDPTAAEARDAVAAAAYGIVGPVQTDDMMIAASEVVTNAHVHGRPPVHLQVWAVDGRLVATVTDRGRGPSSPFAGMLVGDRPWDEGGLGLWLAHQLVHVTHARSPDGYTVRLATRPPGTYGDGG